MIFTSSHAIRGLSGIPDKNDKFTYLTTYHLQFRKRLIRVLSAQK